MSFWNRRKKGESASPVDSGQVQAAINSDGVTDVAINGRDKKHTFLLAVVSDGRAFEVLTIDSGSVVDPKTNKYDDEVGVGIYLIGVP